MTLFFGIKEKLFLMSFVILATITLVLGFLVVEINRESVMLRSQQKSVELSDAIHDVANAFFEVQFWFTEFSLSWQVESQTKAEERYENLKKKLEKLGNLNKPFADILLDFSEKFHLAASQASDSFIEGNRILGTEKNNSASEIAKNLRETLDAKSAEASKNAEDLATVTEKIRMHNQFLRIVSAVLIVIMLFLGFVQASFLGQNLLMPILGLMNKMGFVADKIQEMSHNVRSSSKIVATTTSQQLISAQQVTGILSEISSKIHRTTELATASANNVIAINQETQLGNEVMKEMTHSMGEISETNKQLQSIQEIIQKISQNTTLINDIVFQTRILSFNASVEAARAGEYGKGFSVVAEEVGKLGQMSGDASYKIQTLIEESGEQVDTIIRLIQEKINGGQRVVEKAQKSFQDIAQSVQKVNDQMKDIASASQDQKLGIDQVNIAMGEMNQSIQENKIASEKSSQAADLMSKQSSELTEIKEEIRLVAVGSDEKRIQWVLHEAEILSQPTPLWKKSFRYFKDSLKTGRFLIANKSQLRKQLKKENLT